MGFLARWRAARELRRRAEAYVQHLLREPEPADVRWLAEHGTGGDEDHARWELRYARRALGLLTAQRDALDDRTGSGVAHALAAAMSRDPSVDVAKRAVAARQFNTRLRAYDEVLATRAERPTRLRLGETLLAFAGTVSLGRTEAPVRAGELLASYLLTANEALRQEFGTASLPEDVPPSAVVPRAG